MYNLLVSFQTIVVDMDISSASVAEIQYAIDEVVKELHGINSLYQNQLDILACLMQNDNIIYTDSTNSGKTLPTVLFAKVGLKLHRLSNTRVQ